MRGAVVPNHTALARVAAGLGVEVVSALVLLAGAHGLIFRILTFKQFIACRINPSIQGGARQGSGWAGVNVELFIEAVQHDGLQARAGQCGGVSHSPSIRRDASGVGAGW